MDACAVNRVCAVRVGACVRRRGRESTDPGARAMTEHARDAIFLADRKSEEG